MTAECVFMKACGAIAIPMALLFGGCTLTERSGDGCPNLQDCRSLQIHSYVRVEGKSVLHAEVCLTNPTSHTVRLPDAVTNSPLGLRDFVQYFMTVDSTCVHYPAPLSEVWPVVEENYSAFPCSESLVLYPGESRTVEDALLRLGTTGVYRIWFTLFIPYRPRKELLQVACVASKPKATATRGHVEANTDSEEITYRISQDHPNIGTRWGGDPGVTLFSGTNTFEVR